MTPLLFLSAPSAHHGCERAVIPSGAYRGFQALFGFDAQLRAMSALAGTAGCRSFFLPAPEIFATAVSFDTLRRASGASAGEIADAVHLRFGPLPSMRLLKGARNVAVVAANPAFGQKTLSRHPFANGDRLPEDFGLTLTYGDADGPFATITGNPVPARPLAAAFATGDLPNAPFPRTGLPPREAYRRHASSIAVQSLAEYRSEAWAANTGPTPESADFDGALAEGRRIVAMPWNLCDPGSLVPDLVIKLLRFGTGDEPVRLAVFPYNATPETLARLDHLLLPLQREQSPLLNRTFLMRVCDIAQPGVFRELLPLAWIDAADPECAWVMGRLAALGIPLVGLAQEENDRSREDNATVLFSHLGEERWNVYSRGSYGTHLFQRRTLSVRQLAGLIARSAALSENELRTGGVLPRPQARAEMARHLVGDLLASVGRPFAAQARP